MNKTVFVLLVGEEGAGEVDEYQVLQEEAALFEGKRLGVHVEVMMAPGFDHVRVLRRRLAEAPSKVLDAVVTEPPSDRTLEVTLRELKGKLGLVLLNSWSPAVQEAAREWGSLPFGTVSTDHERIGEIQGRQLSAVVPDGGCALCVTGPSGSSAARLRLDGLKRAVGPGVRLFETESGQWTEADGAQAFNSWYGVFKMRKDVVHAVAGQSDELAVGALRASKALAPGAHRDMFSKGRFFGVDACPNYGRKLVDEGTLTASIVTPPNTGIAIAGLVAFWEQGRPLPLQAHTEATPYPPKSVPPR